MPEYVKVVDVSGRPLPEEMPVQSAVLAEAPQSPFAALGVSETGPELPSPLVPPLELTLAGPLDCDGAEEAATAAPL